VEVSRYCLDTSAYIQFRRGDPQTATAIDGASWVGFPTIALGELYTGFFLTGPREKDSAHLSDFLAHPVVESVSVDDEVARQFGRLVTELRRAGTPLPANDIWIAACAARTSSVVLTHDAHFARIVRVGSVILEHDG
jgi:tRNA(fMet)-specific endonuclease VapC